MCGRYTLKNKDAVKELYGIDIGPNYNVAPSSEVIVLSSGPNIMKWSYSPSWAKKPMNIINARVETSPSNHHLQNESDLQLTNDR